MYHWDVHRLHEWASAQKESPKKFDTSYSYINCISSDSLSFKFKSGHFHKTGLKFPSWLILFWPSFYYLTATESITHYPLTVFNYFPVFPKISLSNKKHNSFITCFPATMMKRKGQFSSLKPFTPKCICSTTYLGENKSFKNHPTIGMANKWNSSLCVILALSQQDNFPTKHTKFLLNPLLSYSTMAWGINAQSISY